MDAITLLLIAVGLAMDAFSVSICSGMASQGVKLPYALRIASFFGGFQALMPLLGWLGGIGLRDLIASFDHWVALALLAFIGGKMIRESLRAECPAPAPLKFGSLLVLSVATSIDALAVGLSFSLLQVSITFPILVIGVVTFILSLIGVYIGKRVGCLFQSRVQLIGGVILVGIGIRIVVEHLV
jgi:putative Mn2+ efflux pump MntP